MGDRRMSDLFFPNDYIVRRERVNELKAQLDEAEDELKASKKEIRVRCSKCSGLTAVGELTYIQTFWYVLPHGCTGGDYWKAGEGKFECPKCGHENRTYNRPEISALKDVFKEVVRRDDKDWR